jgi:type I restriction enzyme S subunit
MRKELPEGWIKTTLGDVAENISYGYTAKAARGAKGPRYLRITDIQNNSVDWASVPSCNIPAQRVPAYQIRSGDLVFARTGATTGKSLLIKSCPEAVFASYLIRVRPATSLVPEFIARFFQSASYWSQISENISGSAQPNCNATKLSSLLVPIPPLAEQRRIVAKLEKLLGEVDRCKQRLTKIPVLVRRFRQSVLAAACSGRLTADWREGRNEFVSASELFSEIQKERRLHFSNEAAAAKSQRRRTCWSKPELLPEPTEEELTDSPEIPDQWLYCRLGNLAEIVRGGSPRPAGDPRYFGGKIPWITVAELTKDDAVYLEAVGQYVTDAGKERSRFINAGTLLLTNSGATLGVPKITRIGGCINDGSVALVDIALISQLYVYYFLKSQTSLLRSINQGAAQPNLNTEIVKNIITPLPPLSEQQEIVRRVEAMFALADRIEAKFAEGRKRVDSITRAILAKAFRGELVPTESDLAEAEGRSYESAEELLERIGNNRHTTPKKAKGRRPHGA